jgi:hypothetical protein
MIPKNINFIVGRLLFGVLLMMYGYGTIQFGVKDLSTSLMDLRKQYLIPGSLNSDKPFGQDFTYKQLSELAAQMVGYFFTLAGLLSIVN